MNLSAPLSDIASGAGGALLQALARLERPVTRRQLVSGVLVAGRAVVMMIIALWAIAA